jgi:hypothetical protein
MGGVRGLHGHEDGAEPRRAVAGLVLLDVVAVGTLQAKAGADLAIIRRQKLLIVHRGPSLS